MRRKIGKIIVPPNCNIREHEYHTVRALAGVGLTVEFRPELNQDFTKSPDLMIDGARWEMKSPKTQKFEQIEKNLKRANKQSPNIIIDSQRIKYIPDERIKGFLMAKLRVQKSIKRLLFVNRRREVVDINKLAR